MRFTLLAAVVVSLGLAAPALAGVRADLTGDAVVSFQSTMDMPFMNVGHVGNAADTRYTAPEFAAGAVDYHYRMGKFEVTAGQYAEFLNAVAASDTYNLYNPDMGSHAEGCKIARGGPVDAYTYSVAADWADRPVNFVSWDDAARFANWLTNGRPTGAQDLTTTEDGSYFLNGATDWATILNMPREADARYVIPTEDEWYKAAYHANDGATANYFDYPTATNVEPSNDAVDPDPGNNANFVVPFPVPEDYTLGAPYWRTEAGEFENSDSPYGTFDMGGNVWEWNEEILDYAYRGFRAGAYWGAASDQLHASFEAWDLPTTELSTTGFRIAEVPEPATLGLLSLGSLAILKRRRR